MAALNWAYGQKDLAQLRLATREFERAGELLEACYPVILQSEAPVEQKHAVLELLVRLYEQWDKPEKAQPFRERLDALPSGASEVRGRNPASARADPPFWRDPVGPASLRDR